MGRGSNGVQWEKPFDFLSEKKRKTANQGCVSMEWMELLKSVHENGGMKLSDPYSSHPIASILTKTTTTTAIRNTN